MRSTSSRRLCPAARSRRPSVLDYKYGTKTFAIHKMAIIKSIKKQLTMTFGKGARHPVKKLEKELEAIIKHQTQTMITFETRHEGSRRSKKLRRSCDDRFLCRESLRSVSIRRPKRGGNMVLLCHI